MLCRVVGKMNKEIFEKSMIEEIKPGVKIGGRAYKRIFDLLNEVSQGEDYVQENFPQIRSLAYEAAGDLMRLETEDKILGYKTAELEELKDFGKISNEEHKIILKRAGLYENILENIGEIKDKYHDTLKEFDFSESAKNALSVLQCRMEMDHDFADKINNIIKDAEKDENPLFEENKDSIKESSGISYGYNGSVVESESSDHMDYVI